MSLASGSSSSSFAEKGHEFGDDLRTRTPSTPRRVMTSLPPAPPASSLAVRRRMQKQLRRNTAFELAVRSLLHKRGLRYRVDCRVIPTWRRRADIVFRRVRLAVFLDGCFWHGCPAHGSKPRRNASWWRAKIKRNRLRDAETTERVRRHGWTVIRVWEHQDPQQVATRIAKTVLRLRRRISRVPSA